MAQQKRAILGHFGSANPQVLGKATSSFAEALGSGVKTDFVSVSAGSQVLAAIAGNSMDLCNIGSSPMVVGFGQGVKMSMVYVQKYITDSESLVVRNAAGIGSLRELKGKSIGLPFNTSVHFALIAALESMGMGPGDVRLLNIKADSIQAAWRRGSIDAAYIWAPILNDLVAEDGAILMRTGDLAESGVLVFDGIVVRDSFKKEHPDLVLAYLKEYARLCDIYRNDPEQVVKTLSPYLSLTPEMTHAYIRTFHPVPTADQATDKWMGMPGAKDTGVLHTLQMQAEFLKSANQLPSVPDTFAPYVDSSFLAQML
ncbi:ABC transporter substrate-binding protein [Parapusillimonas granuli]|uniref:ABC transporter substrate-binding protein n=1 Tax=Parapusillimonas granuli TaxID=380911 RepID=A0A853G3M5_9BURK|nr:ABC transporter substrate-binding protein [Parapusillimonas granuli]MBB5214475.1 taurine transport system substrate-binding protein [Parapusillimonas granuli]MEB2398279.1 ABC transporter substrate-binding protein [Alcaligenaceae bacterium]NYT49116.1 ABC transporter substrate-binding protein [Parapusillimonas granuli]